MWAYSQKAHKDYLSHVAIPINNTKYYCRSDKMQALSMANHRERVRHSAPWKWELGPIMTFRSPTAAAAATEAGKEVIAPAKPSAAAVATAVAAASERRLTRHRKIASARARRADRKMRKSRT